MQTKQRPNTLPGIFLGCVIWMVLCGALLSCLIPVATFGGLTSGFFASDFVARVVGPLLCPKDTKPYIHTFTTTSLDDNGFEQPATGFEMLCLQQDGTSVEPSMDYQNAWIGILTIVSILLSMVIAIVVAGPVGILVNRLLDRMRVKTT